MQRYIGIRKSIPLLKCFQCPEFNLVSWNHLGFLAKQILFLNFSSLLILNSTKLITRLKIIFFYTIRLQRCGYWKVKPWGEKLVLLFTNWNVYICTFQRPVTFSFSRLATFQNLLKSCLLKQQYLRIMSSKINNISESCLLKQQYLIIMSPKNNNISESCLLKQQYLRIMSSKNNNISESCLLKTAISQNHVS